MDLVVSDMRLGKDSGLEVLKQARSRESPPEVILITAYGTPASAVEAMRQGAYDYICKPFDNEELKLLVQKALEKRTLRQENQQLWQSLCEHSLSMVGRSAAMEAVRALVRKVAASRSTVLIVGESGTGKELVARAIHLASPRVGPAVPAGELRRPGRGRARVRAVRPREGRLHRGQQRPRGAAGLGGGGDGLPRRDRRDAARDPGQAAPRAPGDGRSSRWAAPPRCRSRPGCVAATNKRLDEEVRAGRFREDLFYRLNVITIELPPLRERAEDIPELAEFFLSRLAEDLGRPGLRFSPEAISVLKSYPFPGNVRQLQNIVERAATLAESDVLGPETLPAPLRGEQPTAPPGTDCGGAGRVLLAGEAPRRGRAPLPARRAAPSERGEDPRRRAPRAHLP